MLKSEIIAIGTELLMGQVVNTNATTISQFLHDRHIGVYYHTVIGDNAERLLEQLAISAKRSDVIILCGGLGPTEDDITKHVLATFLNQSLIQHQPSYDKIVSYYEQTNRKMPENSIRQSIIIENSIPLYNHNGFATGMFIEKEGVTYIVLPGPPRELNMMLQKEVLPLFKESQETVIVSETLRFATIGESLLAETISDLVTEQSNPTIGIYAKPGLVDVRLSANGYTVEEAKNVLFPLRLEIQKRLSDYYYGMDTDTLESVVLDLLATKGWTLSLSDYMTGGLCSSYLTNTHNNSVFVGGMVKNTYPVIENQDEQVVLRAAEDANKYFSSNVAVSIMPNLQETSHDTSRVNVSIGIVTPTQQQVVHVLLNRDSQFNNELAVQHSLFALREALLEE